MGYAELLKDPRWQKRRLEIMERDEWTCQKCRDTEATLTVHHKSYRFEGDGFADVWDYKDNDLITLCDTCHGVEETVLLFLKKNLYFMIRDICEDATTISNVFASIDALHSSLGRRVDRDDIISIFDREKK